MTTEPDKAQAVSIAINLTELTVKPAVQLVSVFPAGPRGGNPAPIVIDAAGLSDGDMQGIARSYGHESGFVLPAPEGSDCDFLVSLLGPEPRDADVRVGAVWLLDRAGKVAKDPIAILTESGRVEARIARPTTKGAAVEITQAVYQGPRLTFVFQT